jgi:hypothetical protein
MFDVGSRFGHAGWVSLLIAVLGVLRVVCAQGTTQLPKFEDYLVKEFFNQTPHPQILTTPQQRLFRTRIREGVEKGWGVWINGEWSKEQKGPGPNFAGRYVVIA